MEGRSDSARKVGSEGLNAMAKTADETDLWGQILAAAIVPGTVIALVGDLGAGKTRLVRAVATALGADPDSVNSPTFVLMQQYQGRLPLYHFDAYRLRDANEFADLGPEEYFASEGVCFVEWADRVAESLPADHLRIEIAATSETARLIRFEATGTRSQAVLDRIRSRNT
jgi:tRNA threonylcarbamoyladenosine biosynthesis protein TsaE